MAEAQALENTCHFYVAQRNRFCRMTVKEGQQYCGEHYYENKLEHPEGLQRIPCPNDPKHSCFVQRLQKHLKKCNARPKENPIYIVPGINKGVGLVGSKQTKSLAETDDVELLKLIMKIKSIYEESIPQVSEEIYCHSALAEEVNYAGYGPSTRKHRIQNASLLGHIEHLSLLQDDTCFIEFGAGRGQLSYWLGQVACDYAHNLLLLIDKKSHRHKFDKQISFKSEVNVQRLRTDIADLDLSKLPTIQEYCHWVAISKHLCGAATDLALRCLASACDVVTTMGVVMAPCCHHRGDWNTYVGKEFLQVHNICQEEFSVMTGIASWATCGSVNSTMSKGSRQSDRYLALNLPPEERESVGKKCRLILDYGRLQYLKGLGFSSKLVYYIREDISPENLCLIAMKK